MSLEIKELVAEGHYSCLYKLKNKKRNKWSISYSENDSQNDGGRDEKKCLEGIFHRKRERAMHRYVKSCVEEEEIVFVGGDRRNVLQEHKAHFLV